MAPWVSGLLPRVPLSPLTGFTWTEVTPEVSRSLFSRFSRLQTISPLILGKPLASFRYYVASASEVAIRLGQMDTKAISLGQMDTRGLLRLPAVELEMHVCAVLTSGPLVQHFNINNQAEQRRM